MIGGWPRDSRPLAAGAPPSWRASSRTQNNVYFIYYASQVLHHLGGPRWEKWNPRMREYLIDTQATDGHEAGSWYFPESHSTPGRPALHDRDGDHDARGVLPVHAAVRGIVCGEDAVRSGFHHGGTEGTEAGAIGS